MDNSNCHSLFMSFSPILMIDLALFQTWTQGLTSSTDIQDSQKCLFQNLEVGLHRPYWFLAQKDCYPLEEEMKRKLIGAYYEFDNEVLLLLMRGKRLLNGRNGREIAEMASLTGIPFSSVKRQTQNLIRMVKTLEEDPEDAKRILEIRYDLLDIERIFSIIFINSHQINISPFKGDIQACLRCSTIFLKHWTNGKSLVFLDEISPDCRNLKHQLKDNIFFSFEGRTRDVLSCSLQIGVGLAQIREIKDLVLDIKEMILTPCDNDPLIVMDVFGALLGEECISSPTYYLLLNCLLEVSLEIQASN